MKLRKKARNSALFAYGNKIADGIAERDAALKNMKNDAISATAQRQTEITSAQAKAFEEAGTTNDPLIVEGTGTNGAIGVNMADEDLQYLRDIAQRDFINKFSTATLAPNISVKFGDVHETADAEKVAGRIRKILQEEIATAAEGAYV